ncbi:MAG: hypothetical protein A2Y57_00850 [Candidatus Woykebacteria bacterium RBG_13_40_7b]|uniref:HdeD family acid-resistance protein n=1 Tax=Candidatus Woykebacteria bacterium RBG_13_40_7b TaxID=1802594 RepID=A0A1G1WAK9_9BACT|nr:MAG: hypothetical protein A2Y57_00850 [Candidatus Woykebacteria bacterium RBG_13_40_7b]
MEKMAKHWWAILLRGIIAILFAVLLVVATGFTLDVLIILLGLYLVIDGLVSIIAGFLAMGHKNWWLLLIEGVVSVIIGIFVFAWPGATLLILIYLVAIWAIITGIFEFIGSLMISWATAGRVFIGVAGVISFLLGVIILLYPLISLVAMIWLVAIYALVIGLSLIVMSFKLKAAA